MEVKAVKPDCALCMYRQECETAQDGTFCLKFRTEASKARGESPADRWARGEDADLDS